MGFPSLAPEKTGFDSVESGGGFPSLAPEKTAADESKSCGADDQKRAYFVSNARTSKEQKHQVNST